MLPNVRPAFRLPAKMSTSVLYRETRKVRKSARGREARLTTYDFPAPEGPMIAMKPPYGKEPVTLSKITFPRLEPVDVEYVDFSDPV